MRKYVNILLIVIIISLIVVLGLTFFTNKVDTANVTTGHEPEYCIKKVSEDDKKVTYYGLGYKVIRYCKESSKEPFENNIGVAMGDYKLKFELPDDSKRITNMDEFYNTTLTKGNDIRYLSDKYNINDAEKDGCYIINYNERKNENLYVEFMNNYNQNKDAFLRIAQPTVEGDVFLFDILYNSVNNQILVIKDLSRDDYASKENRKIILKEYQKIGILEDAYTNYFVAYNGELNKDNNDLLYICPMKK